MFSNPQLIKRIVTLNDQHNNNLRTTGGKCLLQAIESVARDAESRADSSSAQLASDILSHSKAAEA